MEEIYVNVENVKPVDSRSSPTQTGRRTSERRFHGAVVFCLGLLSVFLLAGLIALGVHRRDLAHPSSAVLSDIKANLTELLQASDNKLSSVSEERDLLNASLTEMTKELHRLQGLFKQSESLPMWVLHEEKTCPEGWRMFSCTCYFFSTKSDSWEKGRQDCRDRGADLVIIDTQDEQKFVSETIKKDSWIGLNDRENEGTWKWIDGTPLTVAYWSGRPDNGGGNPRWGEEDCVQILAGRNHGANWNDLWCDNSLPWICEKMA